MAQTKEDLNRLFQHFRAQGYEGIIAKRLAWSLPSRDARPGLGQLQAG